MRMIVWIHTRTADMGPPTKPTTSTSLTEHHVLMIGIPNFTDRRPTDSRNSANFARRQSNLSPTPLTSIHHGTRASTPTQLTTSTRLQLNIMDH
jgi:hypothetical protein